MCAYGERLSGCSELCVFLDGDGSGCYFRCISYVPEFREVMSDAGDMTSGLELVSSSQVFV